MDGNSIGLVPNPLWTMAAVGISNSFRGRRRRNPSFFLSSQNPRHCAGNIGKNSVHVIYITASFIKQVIPVLVL